MRETVQDRNVRLLTRASEMCSPLCACPSRRMATATSLRVSTPLLSSSAKLHISASTEGGSFEPPNTFTAASPVTTPIFCASAWVNIWLTRATSWGEGANFDMAG